MGENRYNDSRGTSLPSKVWEQLETEERLAEELNVEIVTVESTNPGTNTSTDLTSSAPVLSNEYEIDLVSAIVNNGNGYSEHVYNNITGVLPYVANTWHFYHHASPCSMIYDDVLGDVFAISVLKRLL